MSLFFFFKKWSIPLTCRCWYS